MLFETYEPTDPLIDWFIDNCFSYLNAPTKSEKCTLLSLIQQQLDEPVDSLYDRLNEFLTSFHSSYIQNTVNQENEFEKVYFALLDCEFLVQTNENDVNVHEK